MCCMSVQPSAHADLHVYQACSSVAAVHTCARAANAAQSGAHLSSSTFLTPPLAAVECTAALNRPRRQMGKCSHLQTCV